VLDKQYIDLWLIWLIGCTPPTPPAGNLAQEDGLPAHLSNSVKPSGDCFFRLLDGFLGPSKTSCFFVIDFASKKLQKIEVFRPPDPSKTRPKTT